jgi:uncharacterized protein (TIGR02145 family)
LTLIAFVVTVTTFGQSVAISDDGSVADASAILDVKSTTKGFLPPRMTVVQRDAIASPATGLQIWCSDCLEEAGITQIFNGSIWTDFTGPKGEKGDGSEQDTSGIEENSNMIKENSESINFLGDVKEATANKSIDGTFASNSDIKFPTEKATKTYVDGGEATLSNKTLTAISNTIAAKQLLSATTAIDIYASAAPTVGQVLTATSGSAATWQASKGQASGTTTGDMQYWNGTEWVVVAATVNEAATLQMIGGVPTWTGGSVPEPGTIRIKEQVWQERNLDVATYRDGYSIPQVENKSEWESLKTGAWCWYNNEATTGATYGKLYNWYALVGIWNEASLTDLSLRKTLAPDGWRVPDQSDFVKLITDQGGVSVAGDKLRQSGKSNWVTDRGDNSSGFTGLPGGDFSATTDNGFFYNKGILGAWGSITKSITDGSFQGFSINAYGSGETAYLHRPYNNVVSVRLIQE